MIRVLVLSVSAAVLTCSTIASAAPPKLKGDYAFTGMATCLFSGGPFTSDLSPTVWPGFDPPSGNSSLAVPLGEWDFYQFASASREFEHSMGMAPVL